MMYRPSPSAPAAADVVPNARPAAATVIVVVDATVATSILSPVRAFTTTSPTVKMCAELDPAPVTVIVTPPEAAYVPLTRA